MKFNQLRVEFKYTKRDHLSSRCARAGGIKDDQVYPAADRLLHNRSYPVGGTEGTPREGADIPTPPAGFLGADWTKQPVTPLFVNVKWMT